MRKLFIELLQVSLGVRDVLSMVPTGKEWVDIYDEAVKQSVSGVMLSGIDNLAPEQRPPKEFLLQWIGESIINESIYASQNTAAKEMALLFHENYIKTYVLKGDVVAECYPKPELRVSADMDCYLLPLKGSFDAWSLGNDLMKSKGFEVIDEFYKNSTFYLPGLTVENHRFMTPFRGNKHLSYLEIMLQSMMREDLLVDSKVEERRFEGSWLYRPPVMVTALFLIEHAYSHFLSEGLTWRHILDWMMFRKKHKDELDWYSFGALIDEYGFRRFYDSYNRLGKYLIGELQDSSLTDQDNRMLKDVWAPLDLHKSLHGVKAKISFAFSTIRAAWKYHYFSEISMPHALWIQVKGFLFIKHPTLD